jgi:hypothetical protein
LLIEVLNSDYASIDLVIQSASQSCKESRQGLAASIYDAFHRYEKGHPIGNNACDIVNARKLLNEVECVTIPYGSDNSSVRERASEVANIKSQQIDVILALDDISPIDSLVGACKYGVWFYDYSYSAPAHTDSSWIGFQEVLGREPSIHSALMVRSTELQDDQTAYRSCSSVNSLSHTRTRSEHFWKIRAFVPRVLRDLYVYGGKRFLQRLRENATGAQRDHSLVPIEPSGLRVLASAISYALWRVQIRVTRSYFDKKWILMFQIGGNSRDLTKYIKMRPTDGWFWADPFVVRKENYYYIFFEEASVETGIGHLSVIRMDENGEYTQSQRILEQRYHLSYPFIFEWNGTMYIIPETAENRTIEVYKCKKFPDEWEFEGTLMENVSAYDATLLEHNDTWWLFANVREHEGASSWDELCLFSSDHPLSDNWVPHPMNPVISDARSARPAGKILHKNGRIYRPSQDSSYRYGYALNFCEILELTKTSYKERLVEYLEANWDPSIEALHTYNESGELTIIDAVYRTRRSAR